MAKSLLYRNMTKTARGYTSSEPLGLVFTVLWHGVHRFTECKTAIDTAINANLVNFRGTKQDNHIRPTEQQHTTNRALVLCIGFN